MSPSKYFIYFIGSFTGGVSMLTEAMITSAVPTLFLNYNNPDINIGRNNISLLEKNAILLCVDSD